MNISGTLLEYVEPGISILDLDAYSMEMLTSTLKPSLLLDTVLMKACSTAMNYAAVRKRKHNEYSRSLEAEQKYISDLISSTAGTEEDCKKELLERISNINQEIYAIDEVNNQINTWKKLSQIHLDAETPTMSFFAKIAKQKKKIQIAHLMRKRDNFLKKVEMPQQKKHSRTYLNRRKLWKR